MLNSLKNLAALAASSFLEKDRRVSTDLLKNTLQSQVLADGLEITSLICSDNQVAIQIRKPVAILKVAALLDIVLSEPVVDWPSRSLFFRLHSKLSLDSGLLQRVVGLLVICLIEAIQGKHIVLGRVLSGRNDIVLDGDTIKVDLRSLPGYNKLMAMPLIGSRICLDCVYFKDDGVHVRLGLVD